jgi:hypothetical protein
MVLPSFLYLSPSEIKLFISLIKTNIAATFIIEIIELVNELNEKFITEITKSNKISKNIIDEQINKINNLTSPITKLYLDRWIMINSNYIELLENILINEDFTSLSNISNLDEFMIKLVSVDNNISKEYLEMLGNTDIPSTKRFFNYVVIKMSDHLTSKFIEKQLFIAESICTEIFTKSPLTKINPNPNHNPNPNIRKNMNYVKNWKLNFF